MLMRWYCLECGRIWQHVVDGCTCGAGFLIQAYVTEQHEQAGLYRPGVYVYHPFVEPTD